MKKKALLLAMILIVSADLACGAGAEIHKAAYNGNVEEVRALLKKGVDPDERDSFGGTALHAAMFQKNMEIVRLLLEHGFDPNAVGPKNGYTPLHDAVWADNAEAVKLLLDKGAKTAIKGKDGLTPYAKARQEGKKQIVAIFESRGIKE
ncbi:MAG: ankyrin repeat domain-containing protein [Thermodesulfobacteriota bacterium]